MASFSELKKMIPLPEYCPFCGEKLTSKNSALDHIVPPSLGGTLEVDNMRYLCARCNVLKSDKYNPLFEYYYRLMQNKGMIDSTSGKKIDYILRNMSNEDMKVLIKKIELEDKAYKRLLAYTKGLATRQNIEIPSEAQPSSDELAKNMSIAFKAYTSYDIGSEVRTRINGNIFTYKSDFPIEKYREILAAYGEEVQDEVYSVYIDEEGRLVVY